MIPFDDRATSNHPAVQITIIRTIISNLEHRLSSVRSPEVRDRAEKMLKDEQERLNKYRNQYPEYFV